MQSAGPFQDEILLNSKDYYKPSFCFKTPFEVGSTLSSYNEKVFEIVKENLKRDHDDIWSEIYVLEQEKKSKLESLQKIIEIESKIMLDEKISICERLKKVEEIREKSASIEKEINDKGAKIGYLKGILQIQGELAIIEDLTNVIIEHQLKNGRYRYVPLVSFEHINQKQGNTEIKVSWYGNSIDTIVYNVIDNHNFLRGQLVEYNLADNL